VAPYPRRLGGKTCRASRKEFIYIKGDDAEMADYIDGTLIRLTSEQAKSINE
jgi:hypothetical protein